MRAAPTTLPGENLLSRFLEASECGGDAVRGSARHGPEWEIFGHAKISSERRPWLPPEPRRILEIFERCKRD